MVFWVRIGATYSFTTWRSPQRPYMQNQEPIWHQLRHTDEGDAGDPRGCGTQAFQARNQRDDYDGHWKNLSSAIGIQSPTRIDTKKK